MAKNKKNGSKSGKQKKTAETKPETNAETTAETQTATKEADKKPDTKAEKKAGTKAKDQPVKGYGHGKTDWSGWEMLALAGVLFVCVVGLLALMVALAPGY